MEVIQLADCDDYDNVPPESDFPPLPPPQDYDDPSPLKTSKKLWPLIIEMSSKQKRYEPMTYYCILPLPKPASSTSRARDF